MDVPGTGGQCCEPSDLAGGGRGMVEAARLLVTWRPVLRALLRSEWMQKFTHNMVSCDMDSGQLCHTGVLYPLPRGCIVSVSVQYSMVLCCKIVFYKYYVLPGTGGVGAG